MSNAVMPATGSQTVQNVFVMSPTSMEGAMNLANMMSKAKLVPTALQGSPSDCLLVIEQAMRWGMSPFAVAQSVSVIQGKLMYEGKLVAGVINANGNLQERLSYEYKGQGDDRTITVSGLIKGEKKYREIEVRLGNVKTSNKVWTSQPDQQLMYHGVRVWARRHMPELMLGVYSPEEFEEIDNAPQPVIEHPAQQAVESAKPVANIEPSLTDKAKEFANEIDLCDTDEKLELAVRRFAQITGQLANKLPKWHERILKKLEDKRASFIAQNPELAPGQELMAG